MSRNLRIAQHWVRVAALEDRVNLLARKYPTVSPEQIQDLASVDPTGPKASYLEWLVRQVVQGKVRWPEDKTRLQRALLNYHQVKSKPSSWKELQADPDLFKSMAKYTLHDLEDLYYRRHRQESHVDVAPSSGEMVAYEDGTYKIIRIGGPGTDPKTAVQTACQYAQGTRWCTEESETAESHLKQGPLYIIFKSGRKVAQLHKETSQFMDIHDQPLNIQRAPQLFALLHKLGLVSDARYSYEYALHIKKGRYPEGEAAIARSPEYSYAYSTRVLKRKPFPLGEAAIASSPKYSYDYSTLVLKKKPFPLGEPAIARDGMKAYQYAQIVLRGPFPRGEPAITQHPYTAVSYAAHTLKGRFPAGEAVIATNAGSAFMYAREALEAPFPAGESAISTHGGSSLLYARDVLKGPFPSGERAMANDPEFANSYIKEYLKLTGRDISPLKARK